MANFIKFNLIILSFILGTIFISINIYGEFQKIRPTVFFNDELRFNNDQPLNYPKTISQLDKLNNETDLQFSQRVTKVIASSLAHIHWERFEPEKFNQLVPIWENYFLYFMGKFSGIPDYEKYHFADYKRSLERGIGICGDASMIMSQVLDNNNIDNKIITLPGHVIVSAEFSDGREVMLDADFGVYAEIKKSQYADNADQIAKLYLDAGYTKGDERFAQKLFRSPYTEWDGVKHFITKKYYFEKVSYWLKWPLPLILIFLPLYFILRKKSDK